jgi:hypothetical protein
VGHEWLQYNRFIQVLLLLECYIPAFPQEINEEFIIYRWRVGYCPSGAGARVAFIHRENGDPVTVLEIVKTLRILDIPEHIFWSHADNCMVDTGKATPANHATPTEPSK